jgi:hypothetical protein
MTIETNDTIKITKGCRAYDIGAHALGKVLSVDVLDRNEVRLALSLNGKTHVFFVRHSNRLADPTVRAHKGDPTRSIEFRLLRKAA